VIKVAVIANDDYVANAMVAINAVNGAKVYVAGIYIKGLNDEKNYWYKSSVSIFV